MDILKRKMTIGDMLDYSVEVFKGNFKKFFLLLLVFHIPATFLISLLTAGYELNLRNILSLSIFSDDIEGFISEGFLFETLLFYAGSYLKNIYAFTLGNLLNLAIIKMAYDFIIYSQTDTVKNTLNYSFGKVGWFILAQLIESIVLTFSIFILFFIPLISLLAVEISRMLSSIIFIILLLDVAFVIIYFIIRFSLTGAAIAIDGVNVFRAFRASYDLTRNKFWKTSLTFFFAIILQGIITSFVSQIVTLLPFYGALAGRIIIALAQAAAALFYPFNSIVAAFIYTKYKAESGELELQLNIDRLFYSLAEKNNN